MIASTKVDTPSFPLGVVESNNILILKVLTALWMVPLSYTIYATFAGLYFESFWIAIGVWFILPFFSYLR